ncbi:facilitated trehalose transporter Tret1 [Frankliniella occidentalis]|uniref:Facilitated trehalose transporter Tret1 n=1 Tax=Frankliniella occidentalis TaxID=133901 RepID=A0A6J1SSK7_FRAOC|nr:facilitated trehalose transporter Tret1 [Frankliniella occidentalis]
MTSHEQPRPHPAWLPGKSPQFVATIVVNLIAFSFGCACGWPSVAGPRLSALGCSEEALSWVAAVVWPAGLVGAALFGPLTERLGRRLSALLVAVPLAAGWLILLLPQLWRDMDAAVAVEAEDAVNATSAEPVMLEDGGVDNILMSVLAGRAILGVGMGGVLIVCPMYVGEVVEDALRGQLGSYMPLFINAGILYVYALGAQVGWSALALLCAAFPVAFLALFFCMPETPMYMLSRGDERGAMDSFMWLRDPRRGDVDGELSTLKASVKRSDADGGGGHGTVNARDLVATRGSRHALVIVLGLLALQQFSGITAILNYANSIFDMAGSTLRPDVASVVVAAVQLLGSVAACGLADSLGRLPLLFASYGSMAAALGLLGACFRWPGLMPGWVPVVCLSFYILMYAVGSGPAPFLLLVEVFPAHLRALASQAGLGALFTLAFLVAKFFSTLSNALGAAGCFWLFAGCCTAGVVFIRLTIPETKGRAVDDIVAQLEGGAPPAPRKVSKADSIV